MDSVVGDDLTLPVDINGSCRLPDSINAGEFSTDSMTAPPFSDKMSPIKALTMKDYENQITALKKENFNLKLRIYFMEERMQQKCDDSTEDIFKTNIELKVDLESMKRELAEKQELLVSASKALESLAGRESGEPHRVREQAQREMDSLRDAFNKRIADLEQCLRTAEEEVEKMAAIAEQEKLRNIDMEKQLQALNPSISFSSAPVSSPVSHLQQALQDKDNIIEQLQITLKDREAVIQQNSRDQQADSPAAEGIKQLSDLIARRDQELEALRDELRQEKGKPQPDRQSDLSRLESVNKLLTEELNQTRSTNENLTKTLEDSQNPVGKLEEKENELNSEKKNALKRDKTIQGLTQVLREKEKEIQELCHEIEDRDDALAKAREAAHKAQLQKYQGVEEHQNLLMEKQTELAKLQGEHHTKVLEAQKLQRALDRKEQELVDLQQAKEQLEVELEDLQQQKKKGDKALNDLNNQLKKLGGEIGDRESALKHQYQELLDQTERKLQAHEVTIQRLTSTLADKEQQLQEYINMVRDFEQSRSPGSNDNMLSKLRQRLKEKEKALEQALDEKFAAIEEKDNEIHELQLSLREKERDLDRLNNLLSHNEETINNFNGMIKEKDAELQHLENTLKNLQRAKQDVEDNLNRSLREKDSIISQLQLSLEGKTKDMEEMAASMLSHSQTHARDLAEQMGQRLKVTEAMLAEAVKARERLVADNDSTVKGLLATISSKDQLLKESAERHNRMLSERTQEIQELRRQLSDRQQQLSTVEKQSSAVAQEGYLETAELRALLAEKDSLINKLLQRGQERDQFLAEMRQKPEPDHVLELKQTIQIMQERLDEKEAELSRRNSEDNQENIPLPRKTVVVLKKELAQKTEALNKALKKENELKIALAELQSLMSELEGRSEGQAANIESLTATLKTKEEIISVLHQRLGQRGDVHPDHAHDVIGTGLDRSLPVLPQRESTTIGGNSQQDVFPNLTALQQEHDALNKALRAEQQVYSNLVRTVKEQDSVQRLHALQMELTAVQLLRQQLEDGIKANEELRDDLEREMQKSKLREGSGLIDPTELESVRHQLEDAQRWNTSLQARLGAIQNRGGGVGGANDGSNTLSFLGDQTSYLSFCLGESQDDSLSGLSVQELREKVVELQDWVNSLQTANSELQNRLSQLEKMECDTHDKEDEDLASRTARKQQLDKTQEKQPLAHRQRTHLPGQQDESKAAIEPEEVMSGTLSDDESLGSGLTQARESRQSGKYILDTVEKESRERNRDLTAIRVLLTDCGLTSIPHLRAEVLRLRSENTALRGLLKEQKSAELKEKESTDASGNSSEGQSEMRKSLETLHPEAKEDCNAIKQMKKGKENALNEASDGEILTSTDSTADETASLTTRESHSRSSKQHVARHRAGVKSRLPVPVRLRAEAASSSCPSAASSQVEGDGRQRLPSEENYESDQQLPSESDSSSVQQSVSPSATLRPAPCSYSPAESDRDSEPRASADHSQSISVLFTQLELLHQECQEKETLISQLTEQLSGWEELHSQMQEKDRLNRQYAEALQAAESTIAYLTACSLDSQAEPGSVAVLGRCTELQKALQEKEALNHQLVELLNTAEEAIACSDEQEGNPAGADLCLRIQDALQRVNASSHQKGSSGVCGGADGSLQELQQHADSLQEALWEQNRLNAELQEKLRAAEAAAQHGKETPQDKESPEQHGTAGGLDDNGSNQEIIQVISNCFDAAESAVASLAAHCTNASSLASGRSSQTSSDFQLYMDKLQRALKVKEELRGAGRLASKSSGGQPASAGTNGQKLHQHLCLLYKVIIDYSQRICELQEERRHKGESEVHRTPQDAKALSPAVQAQLEALHKALREKKKTCENLKEQLRTARTSTSSPETARKAPEQDDKGVQVDLQDLGYETSGKSENDREESSSTDLEVGVNPSCSASSLPSLLKREQAAFSSTENLDSNSSTPYPSSPALSSAKVSLKSLQVYDEYGASEDPLQLQGQVRELKVQLENQTRLILQMQSLLRRSSLSSDLLASPSDPSLIRDHEVAPREDRSPNKSHRSGQLRESQATRSSSHLNVDLEREKTFSRSSSDQLQQSRSRSTSPARLDSLVQSQARELSQLRQQMKESRRLGALQRRQLEELSKALKELPPAGDVDSYVAAREQLDKSLSILDRLEGRLDKGDSHLDNEDVAALELSRRLAKELQEKNRVIQSLQSQIRGQSLGSHHSSQSDLYQTDRTASSCHSSPASPAAGPAHCRRQPADWPGSSVPAVGGVQDEGAPGRRDAASRLHGLQRENGRLQEQLRGSEELNATLRSELDLHRSIMAQTGSQLPEQDQTQEQDSGLQSETHKEEDESLKITGQQSRSMNPDLLAEHLQEIRALRQRLEESIRTNDRLREQLERRLAEVEKDPAATNIFIHGNEEQSQLANEVRFLWGQNQALKEQLSLGSRDKQKENDKLRETLARRTAKLEQSRSECDALRDENGRLQERLEHSGQENAQLQDSLQYSKEELHRLQSEVKLQRQQLSDSQHLLQSLRVELQVHEKMKSESRRHECREAVQDPAPGPAPGPASSSSSVDLSELLSEIRHLRLQLERSIQTNTALRQRLEEQLLRGANRSETININYLLSSPDEGGRSPGRDGADAHQHAFQTRSEHAGFQHDVDGGSLSSSSGDSVSGAPSRLVPGHRMWAGRHGRHVLGLIEDFNALRKQIHEGRRLARCMDAQLQECVYTLQRRGRDEQAEQQQQQLQTLSGSVSAMQQLMEEAGRLLKLLWRVSLPAGGAAADGSNNHQQDELLKTEISRLKSRLSQQERMLSGAVKRLRTTNQLKEGMERVIIDQLSLTHGVLKKARGNLETNYCSLFGLKALSGAAATGGAAQWTVADGRPEQSGARSESCSGGS
ncbi:CDK5 regulatory subunit-associated protein 2-like [Salarias fasciatus]|uniref:CDK5 regulatory subunit-associated protein 2-like n=1 Tax=Salarias fasciatus TaxID=181472 RepID=UPI001176F694|nr:CDK5 regulatory subunit-associated protein 2-like [Salarias fasciatus]